MVRRPIRRADHPLKSVFGGITSVANGQGLCEACNYTKEAVGWHTRGDPDGAIETSTPTGHRYTSRPPPGFGGSP